MTDIEPILSRNDVMAPPAPDSRGTLPPAAKLTKEFFLGVAIIMAIVCPSALLGLGKLTEPSYMVIFMAVVTGVFALARGGESTALVSGRRLS